MDSYTLFGHIVDNAGTLVCSRAHAELQGLGVLPEATLQDSPELTQADADVRAAFGIWCGLAIPPQVDNAGKRFFDMMKTGRGQVPISKEGDNFILTLADIIRQGAESSVLKVYISHVLTSHDGYNGKAQIIYKDGTGVSFSTGDEFSVYNLGTTLDDLDIERISRDLRNPTRSWPDEPQKQTARLDFVGGVIQIF